MKGLRHLTNPWRDERASEAALALYRSTGAETARAAVRADPDYRPSLLVDRPTDAARLGLGRILLKCEGDRLAEAGLGSFKPLGVLAALGALADRLDGVETLVCASDGNYGRAVAWAAARLGRQARIFVPQAVSERRVAAIERFGGAVVRVPGGYDACMAAAATDAKRPGCLELSDTGYEGSEAVPTSVSFGYGLIVEEIAAALPPEAFPTHVFVPVGVGGLAAGIAAGLDSIWRGASFSRPPPRLVTVEPLECDCLFASLEAGRVTSRGGQSLMMGLACETPSTSAWPLLRGRVDDALAIPDAAAVHAMRRLAHGEGDPPVVAGETGAATFAALLAALSVPGVATALHLDTESRVLLLVTEGATDPDLYAELVGIDRPETDTCLPGVAPVRPCGGGQVADAKTRLSDPEHAAGLGDLDLVSGG